MTQENLNVSESVNSFKEIIPGYVLRPLSILDYEKGYLDLLQQLTHVGEISYDQFLLRFKVMMESTPKSYYIFVIEDINCSKVVGSCCLVLEYHFIHQCGMRGRIEDVVVDNAVRGRSFGKILVQHLVEVAKKLNVYKLSLECTDELIPFYENVGFHTDKNKFLVQRFDNE